MTPVTPTRTPRQSQLLASLADLFLREGFSRWTLEDLAAVLRCSKTTLYSLADSKEQLVRAVVVGFFREATDAVEASVAQESQPAARVVAYLDAVAEALAPATGHFYADLEAFAPAQEVYERNTALAAARVRTLIGEGVEAGVFRDVHARFVADVVASTMTRIGRGEVARETGLVDAQAYRELGELVLRGIRA